MHRKRHVKRTLAMLLGIVMALSTGTASYAFEGGEYHDFRDGEISIYLPEGWLSEEAEGSEAIASTRPAIVGFEGGQPPKYEQIMKAHDEEGQSGLNLSIYYTSEDTQGDYIYFDDDKNEAEWYYENYGFNAIDRLYEEVLGWPLANATGSSWTVSDPEFFKGQWNGFLVVNGEGNTNNDDENMVFNHTIYLTAQMTDDSKTVVHMLLVFYGEGYAALTEQQTKLAKEIADEFYDYDYYNVLASVGADGDEYSGMVDSDGNSVVDILLGVFTFVVALLGFASTIIVFVRKRAAKRRDRRNPAEDAVRSFSAKARDVKQSLKFADGQISMDLNETLSKWKKRKAQKDSFSGQEQRMEKRTLRKENRAERREERKPLQTAERRSTMQMRNREAESAEQRYYDSLQTLLKTGLLTRDEMRDMLERHERSRMRQRRR